MHGQNLAASPPPHLRTNHWSPAVFMIKPHKPWICWRCQHRHTRQAGIEAFGEKHQVPRIPKALLEKHGFAQTRQWIWDWRPCCIAPFHFGLNASQCSQGITIQNTCPCPNSSQCQGAKLLNWCSHGWKKLRLHDVAHQPRLLKAHRAALGVRYSKLRDKTVMM